MFSFSSLLAPIRGIHLMMSIHHNVTKNYKSSITVTFSTFWIFVDNFRDINFSLPGKIPGERIRGNIWKDTSRNAFIQKESLWKSLKEFLKIFLEELEKKFLMNLWNNSVSFSEDYSEASRILHQASLLGLTGEMSDFRYLFGSKRDFSDLLLKIYFFKTFIKIVTNSSRRDLLLALSSTPIESFFKHSRQSSWKVLIRSIKTKCKLMEHI